MVLDGVSILLIFVPLLAPLMKTFDWDPVWFGVLLTFMVAIGQFTPPVAVNLMVSCRMAGVRIESTIPWVMWFVFTMMLVLAVLVAVPETSLWLPRTLGY
jgi:TRAP-type C4-dicarboxylate transport system permease large subunit